MPPPPRIGFADAVDHVTSRGNGRADVFLSDDDRPDALKVVECLVQQVRSKRVKYRV